MIQLLLFFLFIHVSLLIPGFVVSKNSNLFKKQRGLMLIFSYVFSIGFLSILSITGYVFNVSSATLQLIGCTAIILGVALFIRQSLFKELFSFRFPLIIFFLMTIFTCTFVGLKFDGNYSSQIPDPVPLSGRNYEVFNVKILNLAKTNANDNYVPYRQAQFIVNRSDPAKDSFIDEWGVHFFQRTPLMGSVAASYFTIIGDNLPVAYLWDSSSNDENYTYIKFQILSHILNALFILPAFYLIALIFNKKSAIITCLLLISSQFFLYNSFFSWPKSLVAFFVLTMWILLIKNRLRYTILAGVVGGLAYYTHDLAMLYIAASVLFLLFRKRFRDTLLFGGLSALMALPWLIASTVIYKKPSSFILYPLSLRGLPQPSQKSEIINEFLQTSPVEIISIRFDTLFYYFTPYDLIYSGGQDIMRRIWAVGLFSIPGSLGLGLFIPTILGLIKERRRKGMMVLIFVPIILAALIVGWRGSRAIASFHFAQASIVLLSAFGVYYLTRLKHFFWIFIVIVANGIHLLIVALYSYNFKEELWFNDLQSSLGVVIMVTLYLISNILIYLTYKERLPKWLH